MIPAAALAEDTGTTIEQAAARVSRYERTFRSMKRWLPKSEVRNFLDIGCGLGGVAMRVAKHYPDAMAHLIDGDSDGEKFGYRQDGKPWTDVGLAVRLFARHCPGRAVRVWPADPTVVVPPCELVYSNVSWGHHYPIETYIELAVRSLKPGGTLIVDLRIGEVGEHGAAVLAQHFEPHATLEASGKKYTRTVWRAFVNGER